LRGGDYQPGIVDHGSGNGSLFVRLLDVRQFLFGSEQFRMCRMPSIAIGRQFLDDRQACAIQVGLGHHKFASGGADVRIVLKRNPEHLVQRWYRRLDVVSITCRIAGLRGWLRAVGRFYAVIGRLYHGACH